MTKKTAAQATNTTTKTAKTAKAAPAKAAKPKTEKSKVPAKAVKVEAKATGTAAKGKTPVLMMAKAIKAPTAKVRTETPKPELAIKGKGKLDANTKILNALTRRYVYLAKVLERKQMLEAKTPATMMVAMEATLRAFEDDRQLGTWIRAVPLLPKNASPADHKAAVLRADRGRSFRRKVRSWIEDMRRYMAEQKSETR